MDTENICQIFSKIHLSDSLKYQRAVWLPLEELTAVAGFQGK